MEYIFLFFNHAKKRGTGIIYDKYLLNIQCKKNREFFFIFIFL
jgi:hypothetical protein